MKPITLSLAVLAFAGAAIAQDAPMVEDTDGNGTYSMEELLSVYPDLAPEGFASIDANADGGVDAEERAAAVANGALTTG
jgi:hypothetical protein